MERGREMERYKHVMCSCVDRFIDMHIFVYLYRVKLVYDMWDVYVM